MSKFQQLSISARLVAEEADRLGWGVQVIQPKRSFMILTDKNNNQHLIWSTAPGSSSAPGRVLSENKLTFAYYMNLLGIAHPEFIFDDNSQEEILEFIERHKRVVVKPVDTAHGDGVFLDLRSLEQVNLAIEKALKFGSAERVIIQQFVEGNDYRLLVVGDKVVAATYRRPAMVIGDGRSTIRELINVKNQEPDRGEGYTAKRSTLRIDEIVEEGLVDVESVAKEGEQVVLTGMSNSSKGGDSVDITESVHPEIKDLAIKATKECRLLVAGVDIMASDHTKPIQDSGAIILELNSAPGIRLHHFPGEGKPRNAAGSILDALERLDSNS